jgi:hypothetical protein
MPVPDFAVGEVLTSAAMDSIGLWLIKSQTIGAGVTSVAVTDAFSSNYDQYKITITGGVASSTVGLQLQLGATTTGYYGARVFYPWTGGSTVTAGTVNGANFAVVGVGLTDLNSMNLDIQNPFLSKRTTVMAQFASAVTTGEFQLSMGYLNNNTSYTDFTILTAGGVTLTGGTIRVYGYRN